MDSTEDLERGSPRGVEIQNAVDYQSLIKKKMDVLYDSPEPPDRSIMRKKLVVLFRMNLLKAEAVLYKDYIRSFPAQDDTSFCTDWEELQGHLTRFSHAETGYHALIDALSISKRARHRIQDTDTKALAQVAARLALIEECDESIKDNLGCKERHENLLKQAKTDVANIVRERIDMGITFDARILSFLQDSDNRTEQDVFWQKRRKLYISNTTFAVFGGLSLIIPMLIMTLHQTRLTTLLTSSLCIFAVAATLAAVMNTAEPKDIVGATVGYAAVLVVFVGTGGGGGTNAGMLSAGKVAGIVVGSLGGALLVLLAIVGFLGLFGPGGIFNPWWRKWRFGNDQ